MAETSNTRITRLENLMGVLAEKEARLDGVLAVLAEAQIKTDECFRETDRLFRETDQRFRETDERSRNLDERIDKLVSEISGFLRNKPRPVKSFNNMTEMVSVGPFKNMTERASAFPPVVGCESPPGGARAEVQGRGDDGAGSEECIGIQPSGGGDEVAIRGFCLRSEERRVGKEC